MQEIPLLFQLVHQWYREGKLDPALFPEDALPPLTSPTFNVGTPQSSRFPPVTPVTPVTPGPPPTSPPSTIVPLRPTAGFPWRVVGGTLFGGFLWWAVDAAFNAKPVGIAEINIITGNPYTSSQERELVSKWVSDLSDAQKEHLRQLYVREYGNSLEGAEAQSPYPQENINSPVGRLPSPPPPTPTQGNVTPTNPANTQTSNPIIEAIEAEIREIEARIREIEARIREIGIQIEYIQERERLEQEFQEKTKARYALLSQRRLEEANLTSEERQEVTRTVAGKYERITEGEEKINLDDPQPQNRRLWDQILHQVLLDRASRPALSFLNIPNNPPLETPSLQNNTVPQSNAAFPSFQQSSQELTNEQILAQAVAEYERTTGRTIDPANLQPEDELQLWDSIVRRISASRYYSSGTQPSQGTSFLNPPESRTLPVGPSPDPETPSKVPLPHPEPPPQDPPLGPFPPPELPPGNLPLDPSTDPEPLTVGDDVTSPEDTPPDSPSIGDDVTSPDPDTPPDSLSIGDGDNVPSTDPDESDDNDDGDEDDNDSETTETPAITAEAASPAGEGTGDSGNESSDSSGNAGSSEANEPETSNRVPHRQATERRAQALIEKNPLTEEDLNTLANSPGEFAQRYNLTIEKIVTGGSLNIATLLASLGISVDENQQLDRLIEIADARLASGEAKDPDESGRILDRFDGEQGRPSDVQLWQALALLDRLEAELRALNGISINVSTYINRVRDLKREGTRLGPAETTARTNRELVALGSLLST
ncbi:MAG: hypothetical protein SW833_16825 [Cyanobacteriota bacterium]|nr:hypothetical protein [Cyanobacteriota bacterium]